MSSLTAVTADSNASIHALAPFARFYPILKNKRPACRDLEVEPTTDSRRIAQWQYQKNVSGFAAKIQPDSRLFVLDLESPAKKPGFSGPDGMLGLCSRLEDHDITLPETPTTVTGSGGYHLYFVAPSGASIFTCTALWPGVDVLASGANVILPGSVTYSGTYAMSRSFAEVEIPRAPDALVDLLQSGLKEARRARWDELKCAISEVPTGQSAAVKNEVWFRLWRNRLFSSYWHMRKAVGDTSLSAYEYQIGKAAFCQGLSREQALTILRCWWHVRGLKNRERKFVSGIMQASWRDAQPFIEEWKIRTQIPPNSTCPRGRRLSAASQAVAALREEHPEWSVRQIADAAGITYDHAAKIIRRHTRKGE